MFALRLGTMLEFFSEELILLIGIAGNLMTSLVPSALKVYHIVHIDKLSPILKTGQFLCDKALSGNINPGTIIGMNKIKSRRMNELTLKNTHPHLFVGDCVPFYFCPRSVMLFMIHKGNSSELDYKDSQSQIIHFEADFYKSIEWATNSNRCWAITTSNAGSKYFDDFSDLRYLSNINWNAVNAKHWQSCREEKQAEFLIEHSFDWTLVERIGVYSSEIYHRVQSTLHGVNHKPIVEIKSDWYY